MNSLRRLLAKERLTVMRLLVVFLMIVEMTVIRTLTCYEGIATATRMIMMMLFTMMKLELMLIYPSTAALRFPSFNAALKRM